MITFGIMLLCVFVGLVELYRGNPAHAAAFFSFGSWAGIILVLNELIGLTNNKKGGES